MDFYYYVHPFSTKLNVNPDVCFLGDKTLTQHCEERTPRVESFSFQYYEDKVIILDSSGLTSTDFCDKLTTADKSNPMLPFEQIELHPFGGEIKILQEDSPLFKRNIIINEESFTLREIMNDPFFGVYYINEGDLEMSIGIHWRFKKTLIVSFRPDCPNRFTSLDEGMIADMLPRIITHTKSARNI